MYGFLKTIKIVDTGRIKTPKSNNPTGMTLRIFANGEVYPSQELVTKFNLEYLNKDDENVSNGFDVIDSLEWEPLKEAPRMIMLGVVPKTQSKVDLFGTCRYNSDNTPKSTVLTQGTTNEALLTLVRSMGYLTEEQKYCDLELVLEYPLTTEDGIAYVPKLIERGEKKGEKTYERRENCTYFPLNTVENLKLIREQATTSTASEVAQPTL